VVLEALGDLVVDGCCLAGVLSGADDEVVRIGHDRPHVEDDDVLGQLLLGEAGDPACLFEGRQVPSKRYSPRASINSATAGGTSSSIGSPRATRSRISSDETCSGSISKNCTRSGWGRRSSTDWSRAHGYPGPVRPGGRAPA